MCTHAGRHIHNPEKISQTEGWFHFPLSGCKQEQAAYMIFNAPAPPSCKKTQHTPLTWPRHADAVNPLVVPDVRGEQQLLLFYAGSALVVSFLSLCKVHGSCSSLNRADQFSEETQPLVVKSRDAHAFTYG